MTVLPYFIQMLIPALLGAFLWLLMKPIRRKRLAAAGRLAGPGRESALLLLYMFLGGLLALTLTPAGFWPAVLQGQLPNLPPAFQGGINLTPILQSWALLRYYIRHGLWNAVLVNFPGNILIFMPIGLFAGLLADKPRWWKGILLSFGLSLLIEFFQLFVSRGTDVDDLILNTLGGLLGHGVFRLLRRVSPTLVRRCAKL